MNTQDRPRCVGCKHVLHYYDDEGRIVCRPCEETLRGHLAALAGPDGLFAQLVWRGAEALARGGGRTSSDPSVKSSKIVAPSPVRDQVVNLLGAGGVVHTLQRWVGLWYSDLGFGVPVFRGRHHFVMLIAPGGTKVPRPGQLDNAVRALLNNLPWAAENRVDFGDLAHDARRFTEEIHEALDPTLVRATRVLIGRCPSPVGELTCGAKLMADPFSPTIRCANCGTSWSRQDWPALGWTMRPDA